MSSRNTLKGPDNHPHFQMKGGGLRNDLPVGAPWGLGLRWDLTLLVLLGFHGQCLPSDLGRPDVGRGCQF